MNQFLSSKLQTFLYRANSFRDDLKRSDPPKEYIHIKDILLTSTDRAISKVEPLLELPAQLTVDLKKEIVRRIAQATVQLNDVCFYFGRYYYKPLLPKDDLIMLRLVKRIIDRMPSIAPMIRDRILIQLDDRFATYRSRQNITEPIYLFLVPAPENLSLLSLPILGHELGHQVLNISDFKNRLLDPFKGYIQEYITQKRLALRSTSQERRNQEEKYFQSLQSYWSQWQEEVACDLIGLYLFGPSAILIMQQTAVGPNPFALSSTHPPFNLRAEIALRSLRIASEYDRICMDLMSEWSNYLNLWVKPPDYDQYAGIDDLVDSCVLSITQGLESLNISLYRQPEDLMEKYRKNIPLSVADSSNLLWQEHLSASSVPV